MRKLANELQKHLGETVQVAGWVNSRRDHGGLIFVDLRDHTGLIQLVITPETKAAFALAEDLRDEFVIEATGQLRERDPELVNPNLPTGTIEIVVSDLKLLNRSEPLPVNTHDDGAKSSEEQRLRYRYLDLRRPSMQRLLRRRAEYYRILRHYMDEHDFVEVTTPILANSSPEGARDFIVPSRLHPGQFYALPQAPQQFKQLLMVGGVPRYYQIAPCFRDEDPRADRLYGDFYQLDCEMSFVDDGDVVRATTEPLIIDLVENFGGKTLIEPQLPAGLQVAGSHDPRVPQITYRDAMEFYGTDKPDLRFGMPLVELTDVFANTNFKVFQSECVKALCVKGGAHLTRSQIDGFTESAKKLGAGGLAYIIYEEAGEKSPIAKFLQPEELAAVRERTGAEPGDAVFFGADSRETVNKVLGGLRLEFADFFQLRDPAQVSLCWVIDFPFYEWNDGENKLDFGHNPFSLPKGGLETLQNTKNKLDIVADQYDMVMNGHEICSGAVRNYNPEVMYAAFGVLGYDEAYVAEKFGGLLTAFKFGAPPHAGCAFGIDRIFMVLENVDSIRDIIAFPKNGNGVDLMMQSPSQVEPELLSDAGLKVESTDE